MSTHGVDLGNVPLHGSLAASPSQTEQKEGTNIATAQAKTIDVFDIATSKATAKQLKTLF
jgi:hypothetical protein